MDDMEKKTSDAPDSVDKKNTDPATPAPPAGDPTASYFERLIKYIPGELVAAYLTLDGILKEQLIPHAVIAYWAVFVALLLLTPLYSFYKPTQEVDKVPSARFHAIVSTVAFAVWVFALGGPFSVTWPDLYHPVYGSLLLVVTTLAIPIVETVALKMPFFKR